MGTQDRGGVLAAEAKEMHKAKCLSREGSGSTRHIVAAKAVETQGKGGVLDVEAVEAHKAKVLGCGGGGSARQRQCLTPECLR